MGKFSIGDKVIIRRPENVDEKPGWIHDMDRFNNMECIVRDYNRRGFFYITGTSYLFNDRWAELAADLIDDDDIEFY